MGLATNAIIILLLVAGGVQTAIAASPVTYTCCQNFSTNEGTLIEGFENVSQWSNAGFGGATIIADTTNFTEGTQGIRMNVFNGQANFATKTVSLDLSQAQNYSFDVWVSNKTNISSITVQLSNDAGFTNYFSADLQVVYGANNDADNGRYHYILDRFNEGFSWSKVGSADWNSAITKFRIQVNPAASSNVSVTFDNFRVNYSGRPKVALTFDDGFISVFTKAYPVMVSNNQRGVAYIITNLTGTNGYMSVINLTNLKNNGWDISSHTQNHTDLTNVGLPQLTGELNNSYQFLQSNGFGYSAYSFAYPFGSYNSTVILQLKQQNYIFARTTQEFLQPHFQSSAGNEEYLIQSHSPTNTTSVQTVENWINESVNKTGLLVLLFHNITDGTLAASTDYTLSNFTLISNYIATRTDLDVITFRDYAIKTIPNNTPILNNTVDIYSNGTAVFNGTSVYDQTVNMSVVPSSDFISVKVTAWNTSGDYRKAFTASSNTQNNPTTFTIGDLPINTPIYLLIDGVAAQSNILISNDTGFVTFTQTSWSTHTFELTTTTQDTTHSSILISCNSAISWATIGFAMLVIVLLAAGGGAALMMLVNKTFDGGLLIRYVVVIVVIVIIGTIGLSIANPIVNLLGC